MITVYLYGVLFASILYMIIFFRKNSEITLLDLICGMLACWTSWIAVTLFVYMLFKK